MNYDNKNDAHKLSNYDWWKKNHNYITDVEIDLSKTGISPEKIEILYNGIIKCFSEKIAFALYSPQSMIIFLPETMSSKQGNIITYYSSLKQMINVVKLACIEHNDIYIHQNKLAVISTNKKRKK